jgi:hypothetical protein
MVKPMAHSCSRGELGADLILKDAGERTSSGRGGGHLAADEPAAEHGDVPLVHRPMST